VVKRYYYVVLEHSGKKGKMRAMHSFESKVEFDEWYSMFRETHKIIAQGISAKEAVELSDCIDIESRFAESIIGNGV
jgi:hypothetical protein